MRASQSGSVPELRENLIGCLGEELGTYIRPGLANCPAIWVLDRPIMPGHRVLVAPPTKPLIPAIEIVIRYRPDYNLLPANFNSRRIDERHHVYMVLHDSRQSPRTALLSIAAGFETMTQPQLLEANGNHLEQYHFTIDNHLSIRTPSWL